MTAHSAQDLLDLGDRLVDRLLGAHALGGDAVDRLGPDVLVVDLVVPQIARGSSVIVPHWARLGLHNRGHVVRVTRVEPERLLEQRRDRRQHALA